MLSRTAGALRFRGEVRVHANFEGTAFPRSSVLPARVFTKSYSGLKCLEQTLVPFVIRKCFPSSLLMAWSHCLRRPTWSGNLKNETFLPSSSRQPFLVHSGTQQCVAFFKPVVIIWVISISDTQKHSITFSHYHVRRYSKKQATYERDLERFCMCLRFS